MANNKRLTAILLAALVFFAAAVSLFVVAHEADHDCIGENCPVCAVVALCQNTLKTLSGALAVYAAIAASVCFAVVFITGFNASLHNETPISLKVKLLD